MKRTFTLMACFLCMLFNLAKAAETEPNNTKAQANTLALNGSNTGNINPAGDVDWWRVTTNADGKLNITLNPSAGKPTYIYLYDNNGTIELKAQYASSTFTLNYDGLAAGTYFIKVVCYYNTDVTPYTISNTLDVPAQANDAEPNNKKDTPATLPLNSSKTGHINYYYNNAKDTFDWYKVTTTADGLLRLRITSYNGQNVWAYLYDNDGTTQLAADYTTSTKEVVKDGLAAGTYFVMIKTYYNSEFAPYKLEDSLFTPAQPNDVEPNNTPAQAKVLPLNGSKTGHINYLYNNLRDAFDWYKVTTDADGKLTLRISSFNGQNVWAYLYDNDGTTQLAADYTTSTKEVVKDGLAAGTYLVRVKTYYDNEFAPYKLENILTVPTQANDAAPNDTKTQAVAIAPNSSTTGHINYYYNLQKDEQDWYKLTIPDDGMINITITSHNGQNVWAYLYDNDGVTQLGAQYTASTISYNTDGLRAGTYYLRVNTYYSSEFAPYTLSNTLTTYNNVKDEEPNDYFKQAKTIPANGTVTGHVNFYYNNSRDAVDYWKVNYTGSGNLSFLFTQENRLKDGTPPPTYFQVYKDTAASPISSGYYYATSGTISFTGLEQGYYYIKVFTYYSTEFSSYSFQNTFTQVNKAKIKLVSSVIAKDCSSTNSLTLKCSGSKPPYSVQLLRYGIDYGAVRKVANTKEFTFSDLPSGVYSAKVYGDGATGNAFTKLTPITLAPTPTNMSVTNIQTTQANLNWKALSCASYYTVQYRKVGDAVWTTANTAAGATSYIAKPLTPGTQYEWQVASVVSENGVSGTSAYSSLGTFTTKTAALIAQSSDESNSKMAVINDNNRLVVYPNPATTQFTVQLNGIKTNGMGALWLKDITGTAVWSKQKVVLSGIKGTQVDVSNLAAGMYLLQITDEKNAVLAMKKIIVAR